MGCEDARTEGTIELALELSDCIILAAIAASQATTAGQMFALLLGPIRGELLLDSTLSAELDARLRIDSSLDDDFKSLSRSSSLNKVRTSETLVKPRETLAFRILNW